MKKTLTKRAGATSVILLLLTLLVNYGLVSTSHAQKIIVTDAYPITSDGISHHPSWNQSCICRKLYFTSHENKSSWRLKSYDFADKNISLESLEERCLFPSISPSGSIIAYNSIDENTTEFSLWCWDLLDNSTRRATAPSFGGIGGCDPPNAYTRPSWNFDGSEIFLSGWSNIHSSYVLWSVSLDGSRNQITRENRWDVEAAVSPDGSRIAFSSKRSGAFEIWVSNLDGSDPVQLTFTGRDGQILNNCPCWSPDGKYIAFVSNMNGNADIWYMTSEGEEQSLLIGSPFNEYYPSWSPDGKKIAYCKNTNGKFDIWISEIFIYKSQINCDLPTSMILEWDNEIVISIANNDDFDYNFTLQISGYAFQPEIAENVFVESQKSWTRTYNLIPNEEGNKTVRVAIFNETENIFLEYHRVEISEPAKLRVMQWNIPKEIIPGQLINAKITIINDSEEEARDVGLYLVGDICKFTELSDYRFRRIERDGGYVKVAVVVNVPKATFAEDLITGEIIVNGTNFKNLTVPISIKLLDEPSDPEVEAAWITGNLNLIASVASAIISAVLTGTVGFILGRRTLKKEINNLREAVNELLAKLKRKSSTEQA